MRSTLGASFRYLSLLSDGPPPTTAGDGIDNLWLVGRGKGREDMPENGRSSYAGRLTADVTAPECLTSPFLGQAQCPTFHMIMCDWAVSSNAAFIKDPHSSKVYAAGGRDDWPGGAHPAQGGLQAVREISVVRPEALSMTEIIEVTRSIPCSQYSVLLLQAASLADVLAGRLQRPEGDNDRSGRYPVILTGDHEGCFEARASGSGGRCMFDNKDQGVPTDLWDSSRSWPALWKGADLCPRGGYPMQR
eukprot:4893996-Prymnesium_polylepis.1